ncbi:MAG TPA: hypothetical protein VGW38_27195 [Chloroflexota bacterium]|nr:hypothetical protein [Chloroflexota bacterium]
MTQENTVAAEQLMRTGRSGSSRKLLQRKAAEKAEPMPAADALEDSFPATVQLEQEGTQEPESSSSSAPGAGPAPAPATPPVWSSEDEATLQSLLARRRAAGYQRRGKDVAGQRLRASAIKPNEGTVTATIVGIVAEAGEMTRAALVDAMASADFPHPKARPSDRGWCQGYVAGAIRSGFLAVAECSANPDGEASAAPGEGSAKAEEG